MSSVLLEDDKEMEEDLVAVGDSSLVYIANHMLVTQAAQRHVFQNLLPASESYFLSL